jgi:hypothetical protein
LEAQKLTLAEETAAFYRRSLELHSAYVEYLEWADAFKTKRIKVLETQVEEVSDLNIKEYEGAQQEVSECEGQVQQVRRSLSGLATPV